jgi:nitrogen fixation-related uncharacterized protein
MEIGTSYTSLIHNPITLVINGIALLSFLWGLRSPSLHRT